MLLARSDLEIINQEGNLPEANTSTATSVDPSQLGGIDMNNIAVANQGPSSDIRFDPAAVTRSAVTGYSPVIIGFTRVDDILPLLGLK